LPSIFSDTVEITIEYETTTTIPGATTTLEITTTPSATTTPSGEDGGNGGGGGGTTTSIEKSVLTYSMPASLEIYQNETKEFMIKITNPSIVVLHNVTISITGILKNSYSLTPNLVGTLEANKSTYFTVSINTQDITHGLYTLHINISSKETFKETSMTLKVEEIIPGITTTTITETLVPPEEKKNIESRVSIITSLIIVAVMIVVAMIVIYVYLKKFRKINKSIEKIEEQLS
jgi:hypothetical protein